MTVVRVAIVGSRTYAKLTQVMKFVQGLPTCHVVSGGAPGVDTAAETYAKSRKLPFTKHNALWKKYGKGAGRVRNRILVEDCQILIAFWDGKSPGTAHAIDVAMKRDRPVFINPTKEDADAIYSLVSNATNDIAAIARFLRPDGPAVLLGSTYSRDDTNARAIEADKEIPAYLAEKIKSLAWAPDLPADQANDTVDS